MKSNKLIFLVSIILCIICGLSKANSKDLYVIGCFVDLTPEYEAQIKTIFDIISFVLSSNNDFKIGIKWFDDKSKFISAVRNMEVDFAYTAENQMFYDIIKQTNYQPFLTLMTSNRKDHMFCFYVKKESIMSEFTDLPNSIISINADSLDYYILYELFDKNTESIFSDIIVSTDGFSNFYPVALGKADVTFCPNSNLEYFKTFNPGVVRNIRVLYCTEYNFIPMALLHSPKTSKQIIDEIILSLTNAHNDRNYIKIWNIFRMTKSSFVKVKLDDYDQIINLFDKAKDVHGIKIIKGGLKR